MFIEADAVISKNEIYSSIESIVREYFYDSKLVYVFDASDNDKEILKSVFPRVRFVKTFWMRLYLRFFKQNSILYITSEHNIDYARKHSLKYVNVLTEQNNHSYSEVLSLTDSYGAKIFIVGDIRISLTLPLDKSLIKVLDGDTIEYNSLRYRLLGFDAPELEQEYGLVARDYLANIINMAGSVSISTAEYDIYGRILAHLFVDNMPVAYLMMEKKLAIQTITSYGDNGFPVLANGIIELARKQGRLPFLAPATYRRNLRLGNTNALVTRAFSSRANTNTRSSIAPTRRIATNVNENNPPLRLTPQILMSNKEE